MNCHQCKLVEMLVMCRNDKEVIYQCPKCLTISKIAIEEEQKIIEEQQEEVKRDDTKEE